MPDTSQVQEIYKMSNMYRQAELLKIVDGALTIEEVGARLRKFGEKHESHVRQKCKLSASKLFLLQFVGSSPNGLESAAFGRKEPQTNTGQTTSKIAGNHRKTGQKSQILPDCQQNW